MRTTTDSIVAIDPSRVPYALLLLRLALGAMWISHALLKLLVFTLPGTAGFFESVGLPGLLAYLVFAAELVGGVAIALGLYGRCVSAALLPILLGAAWVHLPKGWVFTASGGGWEYPVFLAVASIVHSLAGDGAFALRRGAQALHPRPSLAWTQLARGRKGRARGPFLFVREPPHYN